MNLYIKDNENAYDYGVSFDDKFVFRDLVKYTYDPNSGWISYNGEKRFLLLNADNDEIACVFKVDKKDVRSSRRHYDYFYCKYHQAFSESEISKSESELVEKVKFDETGYPVVDGLQPLSLNEFNDKVCNRTWEYSYEGFTTPRAIMKDGSVDNAWLYYDLYGLGLLTDTLDPRYIALIGSINITDEKASVNKFFPNPGTHLGMNPMIYDFHPETGGLVVMGVPGKIRILDCDGKVMHAIYYWGPSDDKYSGYAIQRFVNSYDIIN